jgi:hypothetical protein
MVRLLALLTSLAAAATAAAQDQLTLPGEVSTWFVNRDGSCVQCSISNCGVWQNVPQASTLLFDSDYGRQVHGGSGPSRVEAYGDARGIPCYNVTGSNTWQWMKWAAKSGRIAAIGCFRAHFQTLLWFNPDPADSKPWKVRNNWGGTTDEHYEFSEEEFKRHHLASGQWVVILNTPPPPMPPLYVQWW